MEDRIAGRLHASGTRAVRLHSAPVAPALPGASGPEAGGIGLFAARGSRGFRARCRGTSSNRRWRPTMCAMTCCSWSTATAAGSYWTPSPSSRFTTFAASQNGVIHSSGLWARRASPPTLAIGGTPRSAGCPRLVFEKPSVPSALRPSSSSSTGMRPTGFPARTASEIIETLSAVTKFSSASASRTRIANRTVRDDPAVDARGFDGLDCACGRARAASHDKRSGVGAYSLGQLLHGSYEAVVRKPPVSGRSAQRD